MEVPKTGDARRVADFQQVRNLEKRSSQIMPPRTMAKIRILRESLVQRNTKPVGFDGKFVRCRRIVLSNV